MWGGHSANDSRRAARYFARLFTKARLPRLAFIPSDAIMVSNQENTARKQSASRGRNRRHKPTVEEWEAVRQTIRQLYIDENKTLSEVSTILDKEFNFYAS